MWKSVVVGAAAAFIATMPVEIGPQGRAPAFTHWASARAAEANVDLNFFFTTLEPYGSWVQTDRHPYVWVPAQVGPNWSPYTNGHWVYTDRYGWYFESDEPFAPITYHYGRWPYATNLGWYWVPGTDWAPAWVEWRQGGDHVGWAPLPPPESGYASGVDVQVADVPANYWHFVPANAFLAPQLSVVLLVGGDQDAVYRNTQVVGPVKVVNNVVVNNVIDLNFIQKTTNQKVVVRKVEPVADPKQAGGAQADDQPIRIFSPKVQADQNAKPTKVSNADDAKAKQGGKGAPPNTAEVTTGNAPGAKPAEQTPATDKSGGNGVQADTGNGQNCIPGKSPSQDCPELKDTSGAAAAGNPNTNVDVKGNKQAAGQENPKPDKAGNANEQKAAGAAADTNATDTNANVDTGAGNPCPPNQKNCKPGKDQNPSGAKAGGKDQNPSGASAKAGGQEKPQADANPGKPAVDTTTTGTVAGEQPAASGKGKCKLGMTNCPKGGPDNGKGADNGAGGNQ